MATPFDPTPAAERRSLLLVLFAALVLRLWRLGALSVWTDEASTWTAASGTLDQLWRFCATKDASPPLFHFLTWLSLRLSDDEVHLRLVPVIASLALVWVTYRLARLWADRRESTLAAALVALSPYQLMYAQEARTYMLVGLWTVLGLYLYARAALLDRPRAWWPLSLVIGLGLWTQAIAVLGLGVQGLLAVATPAGRRHFGRWLLAVGVGVLLYLPWLIISMRQTGNLGESHWYVDAIGGHSVFHALRALLLAPVSLVHAALYAPAPGLDALVPPPLAWVLLFAVVLVPLVAGAVAALRPGARGDAARFAFVGVIAPLAAVFVVSLERSLWMARYFVFLTPFVAMLIASGLMTLRPAALARISGALVLLLYAYGCMRVHWDYGKERWREVTESVGARALPDSSAVLVPFDSDPFRYYDRRLAPPLPCIEVSHPEVPFHSRWTAAQMSQMEREARTHARPYQDVWVIVRSPNSDQRRQVAAMAESVASDQGRALVLRETWDSATGELVVSRFRRGTPVRGTELIRGR